MADHNGLKLFQFLGKRTLALLACSAMVGGICGPDVSGQTVAPAPAIAPAAGSNPAPGAATTAFDQSLALRTDRIVADPTHTAFGWLAQTSPVAYVSKGALQLKLSLYSDDTEPKAVKALGTFTIYGGDLAKNPFPFSADLSGVTDGYYRYVAEVLEGDASLVKLEKPVVLVAGLDEKQVDFAQRLAKISGHDSAKAGILYPFDLARVINLGRRVYGSNNANPEFGLSQAGTPQLYDFPAGLKRSDELLAALEAGGDPVWRAGGERVRYYFMPEAGEILPYHVFVPSTWDGKAALPLVFILHGNSRDQDYYFDRDDHIIPKAAEKHGYMLVAPLGYAPNAGYNYVPFGRSSTGPRGLAGAMAASQNFGPLAAAGAAGEGRGGRGSAATGFGGVNGSVTPALVRSEWSEQDAMHVFDLIRQEYPIDAKRTFLLGYSAGGQGAHYLGQKFAENWVAIAIGGSNAAPGANYAFERLKHIPLMLFVGAADQPNINPARTMFQAMQQHGLDVVLKEYPGADHDHAPSAAIADIFDFFDAHPGK